jgi:hypothetical protein
MQYFYKKGKSNRKNNTTRLSFHFAFIHGISTHLPAFVHSTLLFVQHPTIIDTKTLARSSALRHHRLSLFHFSFFPNPDDKTYFFYPQCFMFFLDFHLFYMILMEFLEKHPKLPPFFISSCTSALTPDQLLCGTSTTFKIQQNSAKFSQDSSATLNCEFSIQWAFICLTHQFLFWHVY